MDFQKCLVDIRDTMESVLFTLRMSANGPIFDFATSTETQIESHLKNQTDDIKNTINSKTDPKCLSGVGITVNDLSQKYRSYSNNVTSCINAASRKLNTEIIQRFNPEHFPALALLNRIGMSLATLNNRAQLLSFVS